MVVIMGVAGSGKTTVGTLLSRHTGWAFVDADTLHPPENVAKMRAGIPLTDADRWPWLERVAAWIRERRATGADGIVACSALKRAYRDFLRRADPKLYLVYLRGERTLIDARLGSRTHHFFPQSLVSSQFADLEEPQPDEHPITIYIGQPMPRIIEEILVALGR